MSFETLEFRMITHVVTAQAMDVGDADGHTASVSRFSGLAFFADDSVASASFVALTDYINGAGEFTLYPILTFDDGAQLCIKSVGTGAVDGARTNFVGTLTVRGGKGRFAGAKGKGTSGIRYTPLSLGADLVSHYIVQLER